MQYFSNVRRLFYNTIYVHALGVSISVQRNKYFSIGCVAI